jgi:UDP-glucose 4-epimerase
MSNKPSSFLVTGGAGFIGGHMAQWIRSQRPNAKVRVIDNLSTGRSSVLEILRREGGIDIVEGDLLNDADVERAVDGVEAITHLAAIPSVPRSVDDPISSDLANVHATVKLLDAARKAGARRVVYAASSSAYGNQEAQVKSEDLLPGPLSPYAVSKLAGEHYLRAFHACYGLETVALRYFNVFGPRQDPNSTYAAVIPKFITLMLQGKSPVIYGDGKQSRDFTFVENNCRANLMACEAPADSVAGKMVNVACGGSITLLDLIDAINENLGTSIEPQFDPPRAGDVMHSLADISAAKAAFGYEPVVSLEDGLKRTIAFYKEELEAATTAM